MDNYDDLIKFRNKLVNDADYDIYEEDCQLLDRVLDDYEKNDQRIVDLEKENSELKQKLENAIVLKFENLSECFIIIESEIIEVRISYIQIFGYGENRDLFYNVVDKMYNQCIVKEQYIYATQSEAEDVLKKLKEENR